uniref:Uncharacterized protein n=1 Tax=Oryza sativa subsp. japonica TaxID=39947 RepID=Q5Z643_ORYSJ|nr:hypothetical protein [Oryza sativa Japonica Group]
MGSPQEHFSCGGQRPPDECESERGGVFEWTEEEDPACFAMDLERLRQSDLTLGMDGENCHVLINSSRNKNHLLKGIIELIKIRKEIGKH